MVQFIRLPPVPLVLEADIDSVSSFPLNPYKKSISVRLFKARIGCSCKAREHQRE